MEDESTIKSNEYHPSVDYAMEWFKEWRLDFKRYAILREAIASSALAGNRLAQICNGTLDRLEKGDPISDRYLLGLCWFLRDAEEKEAQK